jgi:uncharacterized membrane protein (UPF0127 family)
MSDLVRCGATLSVRLIADTADKRERGLMFAHPLQENEAALFVFPQSARYAFWNQNVSFGLSLAFLDENRRVVDFADMDAHSTKRVEPSADARYVVEASRGTWDRLGVGKGDVIEYVDHHLRVRPTLG